MAFVASPEGLAWILVALGVIFRVNEYAANRTEFLDEAMLKVNLIGYPILPIKGPLNGQLAPPAFLVIERAAANWLGPSRYSLRFFPLVCGLGSLFLFQRLAWRTLDRWAVPLAVALFAFSDDLVYYSSEMKQYSSDIFAALACVLAGLHLAERPPTAARLIAAAALGVVATWFSHPSVFVLAGVATWLVGRAALHKQWADFAGFLILGLVWAASFLGCYLVSRSLLTENPVLWPFWHFAFLPLPPRSLADLATVFRHLLNLFVNPVNTITPLGPFPSAAIGLTLTAIGGISLAVRKPVVGWMLLAPVFLAMVASSLQSYPFHARVVLYLLPAFVILIAEGIAAIGRHIGKAPAIVLGLFLLVTPASSAIGYLSRPHLHAFDAHGDLRRDLFNGEF